MKRPVAFAIILGLFLGAEAACLGLWVYGSTLPQCCEDLRAWADGKTDAANACLHTPGCDYRAARDQALAANDQWEVAYHQSYRYNFHALSVVLAVGVLAGAVFGSALVDERVVA